MPEREEGGASSDVRSKSLSAAVKIYLKDVKDRNERSLLKRFCRFMPRGTKCQTLTDDDFDRFLESLELSPSTLKNRQSILKRFKHYIGLETTPSTHGGRKSRQKEFEPLKRQYEKKISELKNRLAAHQQTVDELNARITMINSKRRSIKELDKLEQKKAELKRRIDELKQEQKTMRHNVRIYKVICPLNNRAVSLGDDCHTCNYYIDCPVIGKERARASFPQFSQFIELCLSQTVI